MCESQSICKGDKFMNKNNKTYDSSRHSYGKVNEQTRFHDDSVFEQINANDQQNFTNYAYTNANENFPTTSHFRDEEVSSEITADDHQQPTEPEKDVQINHVIGWIAFILSIASYFFIPIILGGAGIILGFLARNRGSLILGNTAIVAGIVSIIIRLFVIPFVIPV